ncbi:MAG: metal-binding protein [Chitinophagaceae bacterium]|nr:MAG: metal-binding protein [Chitinophagaceae bacterium]
MILHTDISDSDLRSKIRNKEILVGGNKNLKIYGTLRCMSGQRMKRENRIFFRSETEADNNGYRPCGNCMKAAYKKWRIGSINATLLTALSSR